MPPTSALFAAFLGYNPVRTLLGGPLAGVASWFRGGKYHHADEPEVTLTMGAGAADYAPATTSAETAGARTGVSGG
jgi:hypothetical protein